MRTGTATGFVSSLFLATALLSQAPSPQNQTNAWHYFHPVPKGTCQTMFGPDAQQDLTIGLLATPLKPEGPLKVTYVAPSGPAADAGIREGDLLWGRDPNNNQIGIDSCGLLLQERSPSPLLILYAQSQGQQAPVQLTVKPKPRREVYPGEAQLPVSPVSEYLSGGRIRAGATLAQGPHGDFELRISVQNSGTDTLLQLDDQKIFLLDASSNQLVQYSYAEWKRSIEGVLAEAEALAKGMEQIPYVTPPCPPPPTQYRIAGTADGTYTLTPIGNNSYELSGESRVDLTMAPEYTMGEQMEQAAGTLATIIQDIRIARANRKIKKLRQKAEGDAQALRKILAAGTAAHLDTTLPIAPSAIRGGSVEFLPYGALNPSKMRAILVVSDASSKKDYFVTFEFHP